MNRSVLACVVLLLSCRIGFGSESDAAHRLFDSAVQSMQTGNFAQAEQGFRRVLTIDRGNVSALTNLGIVYAQTDSLGLRAFN